MIYLSLYHLIFVWFFFFLNWDSILARLKRNQIEPNIIKLVLDFITYLIVA